MLKSTMSGFYNHILDQIKREHKLLAVLVDPDKSDSSNCKKLAKSAEVSGVDFFFIGSSILTRGNLDLCLDILKNESGIPVILFPGNIQQISSHADAILFLSLISGRNPELLIGNHVLSAPVLKSSGLEIVSTGYMLIESGASTAVSYMSNSQPIPSDKDEIAWATALAGEMLGMKLIYLEAGSGARHPVRAGMIRSVRSAIKIPLIVGGGIRTAEQAMEAGRAGADVVVIGNVIEKNPGMLPELAEAVHSIRTIDPVQSELNSRSSRISF